MRDISEIIKELYEHPEYIHHSIFTKDDVVEFIKQDMEINDDDTELVKEILTKEDYEGFEDWIYNVMSMAFEYHEYDYPEDLLKKINRHVILNKILKGEK